MNLRAALLLTPMAGGLSLAASTHVEFVGIRVENVSDRYPDKAGDGGTIVFEIYADFTNPADRIINVFAEGFEIPAGDLNWDGCVDAADLAHLMTNWGTTCDRTDLTGDGVVDEDDLALLLASWSG